MPLRIAVLGTLAALGAIALPLATYTLSLAAFGLAHVASELRYVDMRFGPRLARRLVRVLATLLAGIVLVRLARVSGMLTGESSAIVELLLVVVLTASVVPELRQSGWRLGVAVAAVLALGTGLAISPMHTLLVLAILHNITPVGFLAEATEGSERRRAMGWSLLGFVVVPLFIASGAPFTLLARFGWVAPELSILPAGPLAAHLGAYLPSTVHGESWAFYAFSAFVFMQCLHYIAVIDVLPRLEVAERGVERTTLPWPRQPIFVVAVIGLSLGLAAHFWLDFAQARSLYGVAAAVHAWVELPLLLLALAPAGVTSPTP